MDSSREILKVSSFSYSYPGAATAALSDVSLSVSTGECVCLTGDSGCGKSTLLLAIKGLLRGGRRSGTVEVAATSDRYGNRPVGIVFQNAESQILCTTVAEEVAFGPENLCVAPEEIARRVGRALKAVGLEGHESRNVDRFSAGQKQRIAIASVLSMNAALLLMDEPSSQLDADSKRELCDILSGLKRQGYAILLAEHDMAPFAGIIDRYLTMENGRITGMSTTVAAGGKQAERAVSPRPALAARPPVLCARDLWLAFPETEPVLRGAELAVGEGERVHVLGRNGAGKSSLLRCIAGLVPPDAGSVEVTGVGSPRPERLAGRIGVLFQNPSRQLFCESVREEVSFGVQRLGYRREEVDGLVAEALRLCSVDHLAQRPPLTLSFGEQHRVALASVLAPRPKLLLLDEPFAGLDMAQRRQLLALLGELPAQCDTAVLIATHDVLPDACWADRSLILEEGRLTDAGA